MNKKFQKLIEGRTNNLDDGNDPRLQSPFDE